MTTFLRHRLAPAIVLLIALTGYDRPEDRERSAEAGFDFHMGKPAELDTLRRLLDDSGPARIP